MTSPLHFAVFPAALLAALLGAGTAHAVGSAPPEPAARAAARESLRVQETVWQRLREEFERLLARGALRPAEADDYRAFLADLERRVEAERARVAALGGDAPERAAG
ncbi:MAG: hypothetical protein R3286_00995, partial [Gammaproteobacteria bacterium]|nr:hypothetical protein [Gammaproteobacteria bacterium]